MTAAAVRAAPPRRRYHFHAPGVMYVVVTLFLALGAINSQNNLLFAALGLAIGGLLVSGVISGASLLGARIQRDAVQDAIAGRPAQIGYTVTNTNRFFPAFGICIVELPVRGDQSSGGWQHAMPAPRAFIPYIAPGRSVRVEATVTPWRRGQVGLRSVQGWTTFPFGLTRKSVTFDQPATAIIRPMDARLRPALIREVSSPAPHGDGAERRSGQGQEFFALREYSPGDNPRRISWRRSARTGDLIVRQEAVPAPRRLWVVLQPNGPDGAPVPAETLERAVVLAAAAVRSAIDIGMAVGLLLPGLVRPPRTGARHTDLLLCDLAAVSPGGELDAAPALGRSGAALIVTAGGAVAPALAARGRTLQAADIGSATNLSPSDLALLSRVAPSKGSAA